MLAMVYDRVAEPAYSLAIRILKRPESAEEIVAAAFEQLNDEVDVSNADVDHLGAIVLSLIRQRAIVRRNTDAATSEVDTKRERPAVEIPKPTSEWRERLLSPAARLRLQQSLAQLASEERTAIELVFFEGLTQYEVSDRLTLPIDTIRLNVEHGLRTLAGTALGQP